MGQIDEIQELIDVLEDEDVKRVVAGAAIFKPRVAEKYERALAALRRVDQLAAVPQEVTDYIQQTRDLPSELLGNVKTLVEAHSDRGERLLARLKAGLGDVVPG